MYSFKKIYIVSLMDSFCREETSMSDTQNPVPGTKTPTVPRTKNLIIPNKNTWTLFLRAKLHFKANFLSSSFSPKAYPGLIPPVEGCGQFVQLKMGRLSFKCEMRPHETGGIMEWMPIWIKDVGGECFLVPQEHSLLIFWVFRSWNAKYRIGLGKDCARDFELRDLILKKTLS